MNNISLFDYYFVEKFKYYFGNEKGLDVYIEYIYKKLINKKDIISSATMYASNIIKIAVSLGYSCEKCMVELRSGVMPKYGSKLDKFRFSILATMVRNYLGDKFVIQEDATNTNSTKTKNVYIINIFT